MDIATVQEYSKITGKSVETIRTSLNICRQHFPVYVYFNGEYRQIDKEVVCVIYGEGAPETIRDKYNKAKNEKRLRKMEEKKNMSYDEKKAFVKKQRDEYLLKNPHIKFQVSARNLIYNSFKRACNGKYKKSNKSEKLLGCSMEEFILHITSLFEDGMTIDNHGEWHIDHIKPLKLAKTEQDIIKLSHYTNLQPLWAKDNIAKGSKYDQN